MDIRKLQRAIVDGLEDVKAQNIAVFNTEALSPLFERVIVASGTSNRQTKALAASVRDAVKSRGFPVLATEGEANGEWIIVDCGPAVAHIMQPAVRDYYRLEEIWGGKPVRLKGAARAAPAPARGDGAAAGKAATTRATTPAVQQAARPASKAAAPKKKPAAGSKTGPARTGAARAPAKGRAKAPAKAPAKGPAKGPAKAPPRKTAARKTAARKTAARRP